MRRNSAGNLGNRLQKKSQHCSDITQSLNWHFLQKLGLQNYSRLVSWHMLWLRFHRASRQQATLQNRINRSAVQIRHFSFKNAVRYGLWAWNKVSSTTRARSVCASHRTRHVSDPTNIEWMGMSAQAPIDGWNLQRGSTPHDLCTEAWWTLTPLLIIYHYGCARGWGDKLWPLGFNLEGGVWRRAM